MKKLSSLFLWFCAATVLAQIIIIALSYFRGNINADTLTKLVATLNGIEIEGQRLQQALDNANKAPIPTREEVIAARAQKSLEFDQRERALNRKQEQLESLQAKLQVDIKDFDARRLAFEEAVAMRSKSLNDQTLGEVQKIVELLEPGQASGQLIKMMDNGSIEDVVSIVKALPDDKRTKILREFEQADPEKFKELLGKIRAGVDLSDGNPVAKTP